MKTKIYLFRIVVGSLAFLFSLGVYAVWRYVQTPVAAPILPAMVQTDAENLRATYPTMPSETKDEPPMPEIPKDEAETKFDAEGEYQIAGDAPKGFEDFVNFYIINKDYKTENEEQYGTLIAPEGYIQTSEKEFKFNKISIGSEQIQFETERVKGISYTFSGRFTETRNFVYLEAEAIEKVLEGRLIKKRSGKKIAEAQVVFGWSIESSCGC